MKRHEIIKMLEKFEMIDVNGGLGIPPKQYNSLAYEIEQLTLTDVSQHRELLIAYELIFFKGKEQCTQEMAEKMVDNYLKAINCG